jgi:hypothetical protein
MYESGDRDGSLAPATIVVPIERCFNLTAKTSSDVELQLRKDVMDKKLPTGRVYQINPMIGNPEAIRSIALDEHANVSRVFLDPAKGLYSEFRRIRYPDPTPQLPILVEQPDREMVEA